MVPRRSSRGGDAAATEALTKLLVRENPAHSFDDGLPLVRNDERLAVSEKAGDAGAIGDDDRRPRRGRLCRDDPEALAGRGEDEDVGLRIQVMRWPSVTGTV